ncbi:MAG: putative Ig domain-containing protein [Anaerolineae bacterium]|nr:putative Ig domain-containing protein [Anaerolineae bacterium]
MTRKLWHTLAGLTLVLIALALTLAAGLNASQAAASTSAAAISSASILYAAPTAQGSGDCSAWADACTLQTALTGASTSDEIWVAAGIHYPGNAVTDTFSLQSGVALYGGFAGTETARDQRDWQTHVTVLSGDIDQNDLTDPHGVVTTTAHLTGTNVYHVVYASIVTETAVLDGFTITAGHANGALPDYNGGGMHSFAGNPTLSHITFSGNLAAEAGGGMYNRDSSPQLTHIIFTGNTAKDGGGMLNYNSHSLVTDVTFIGNSATNNGGGMDNEWYSAPVLTRVRFEANHATMNGGGLANAGANLQPVLQDVIFSHNTAGAGGGGIYNPSYQNGIYTNVLFIGNTAVEGGAMYNHNITGPILTNGLFMANTATRGGAIYNYRTTIDLINVTFTQNSASEGGALYSTFDRGPYLKNAILWGDTATLGPEIFTNYGSASTFVSYSDVQGCGGSGAGWDLACGTDNGSNIDADPHFVDASGGNLHLQPASPAIDAGINAAVPITVTTDLDDNRRFADVPTVPDTGAGTPPIVDMGAYETQANVMLEKSVLPEVLEPGQPLTFTLNLSNQGTLTATQVIITDTLPTWLWGASVASTLTITDTGALPPWVWLVQDLAPGQGGAITISAVLTVPLAAGTYTNTAFISAADDPLTETNTAVITFTVSNVAPVFTSAPLTAASEATPYTYAAMAEDNNGDTLTLTAPTLPAWLTLTDHGDGTATLSGTPTNAQVGDHAVVLHVTDSAGLSAEQTFTVTVTNVNDAPTFTSTPVTAATQGMLYTATVTATDPDLVYGDALTLTATTLPGWLTLTDHGDGTATLSGTPSSADGGSHTVVLRVTDSGELFDTQTFTISVSTRVYLPLVLRNNP